MPLSIGISNAVQMPNTVIQTSYKSTEFIHLVFTVKQQQQEN